MVKEIIFGVVGGLGLFIYGIWQMSEGLHKASGERMRRILHNFTGSPIKGVLVGAGITSLVQSSSATTVMVVGFVNAGLMTLMQALGVIFGANIGTTVTAQLVAFKLTEYALPIIGLGMFMLFVAKKKSHKHIGEFLLGFGILFLGLNILTGVIKPLSNSDVFNHILLTFSASPLLGILAGAAVTAILQSSSVTTGMVLGLAMANLIDLKAAIPLILGCNIGTCVTALLASIGANISAKRAALAHIMFNVIGVLIFFPFLGLFTGIVMRTSGEIPRQIANAHTLFNVINTFIFLPFVPLYAKFLTNVIKGEEEEEIEYLPKYLEKHLLHTPPIAIEAATKEIVRTLQLTQKMVSSSMKNFFTPDEKSLARVAKREEAVDALREGITNYLVELMQRELSEEESKKIPPLIHVINDVERIGDHAENLMQLARQKMDSSLSFSGMANEELRGMHVDLDEMINCSVRALSANSTDEARRVLEQECKINSLRDGLKSNHVKRLERGQCNVLSGVVFLDTISNLEKIGDHLNNVAQAVMEGL
ncbi:MAG: Na/Pi cotransporter family protein [Candidatus Omnitrophota bacterium]|jgi:phosphate:Na+ symporter|nr:MAG: Na/Pi cotransporter family protein [Candidatus Omnitrophota bacterium]